MLVGHLRQKKIPERPLEGRWRRDFWNGLNPGILARVALQMVSLLVHQVVPEALRRLRLHGKQVFPPLLDLLSNVEMLLDVGERLAGGSGEAVAYVVLLGLIATQAVTHPLLEVVLVARLLTLLFNLKVFGNDPRILLSISFANIQPDHI